MAAAAKSAFFEELYGPAPAHAAPAAPTTTPYATSNQLVRWSSLRVLIWEFKEKGLFTAEEAERLLAKLESEPPPL